MGVFFGLCAGQVIAAKGLDVNNIYLGLHLAAVRFGRVSVRWSGLPGFLRGAACLVQRGLEVS